VVKTKQFGLEDWKIAQPFILRAFHEMVGKNSR